MSRDAGLLADLSVLLPFLLAERSQVFTASNYCPIVSAGSEVRTRPGEADVVVVVVDAVAVGVVVTVAVVIRLFPGKRMIRDEWKKIKKCD